MRGKQVMFRRLVGVACMLGLLGSAMVGVGLVRAAEPQEFPTREECEAALGVLCTKTERGTWTEVYSSLPENRGEGSVWDPFSDPEWIEQNKVAMDSAERGEPLHPVVALDLKKLAFPDALPWINPETGRTMLPVRHVAETLGAQVEWDQDTWTATISRKGTVITLVVNDSVALVNGQQVTLDAPLLLVPPGRILVPLRFVAETFGLRVDWVGHEQPPGETVWSGRYQVWLWDPDGYWGPYTIEDRQVAGWWLLRRKEVNDILTFCRGEEIVRDSYTHWTPREDMRPKCDDLVRRFAEG